MHRRNIIGTASHAYLGNVTKQLSLELQCMPSLLHRPCDFNSSLKESDRQGVGCEVAERLIN
eukprot:1438397-Amphidinium_carterae.1